MNLTPLEEMRVNSLLLGLFGQDYYDAGSDPWVGLHVVNRQWVYTDGTPFDFNVGFAQPNASNLCVDIHAEDQGGWWGTPACDIQLERICKVRPSMQ